VLKWWVCARRRDLWGPADQRDYPLEMEDGVWHEPRFPCYNTFVAHWVLAHQFSSLLPGSIVRSSAAKTYSAPRLNCDKWVHLVGRRCCMKYLTHVDGLAYHKLSLWTERTHKLHRTQTTRIIIAIVNLPLASSHRNLLQAGCRSQPFRGCHLSLCYTHKDHHFTRSNIPGLRSMCKGLSALRSRYSLGRVCNTSALRL